MLLFVVFPVYFRKQVNAMQRGDPVTKDNGASENARRVSKRLLRVFESFHDQSKNRVVGRPTMTLVQVPALVSGPIETNGPTKMLSRVNGDKIDTHGLTASI